MRFNALENFFRKNPDSHLPREIFHDDKAFKEFFIKSVGQKNWAKEQAYFAKQQMRNGFDDNVVNAHNVSRLIGTEWIDFLNPGNLEAFEPDAQFTSFEDMPATWALHFLQVSPEKFPDPPGFFTIQSEADLHLPKGKITDQITQLEIQLTSNPAWSLRLHKPDKDNLRFWSPEVMVFIKELGLLPLYTKHSQQELRPHWKYALE